MVSIDYLRPLSDDKTCVDQTQEIGNTHIHLVQTLGSRAAQEDVALISGSVSGNSAQHPDLLEQAFADIARQAPETETGSGSTATIATLATDNKLTLAQLGDSMAFLFVLDPKGHIAMHPLVKPHSLDDEAERDRAAALGGKIINRRPEGPPLYRLRTFIDLGNGRWKEKFLATPRAFGDKHFTGVSVTPDIKQVDISEHLKAGNRVFLCLASDGFFHKEAPMALDDYAAIIKHALEKNQEAQIPKLMARYACQRMDCIPDGAADNTSILFAEIPPERTENIVLGVFDGHGGDVTASYAAQRTREMLAAPDKQVQGGLHVTRNSPHDQTLGR